MSALQKQIAFLWLKLVASVVAMLALLAMVVWFLFEVRFENFYSQMVLYFVAMLVGVTGVMIAFRTKIIIR